MLDSGVAALQVGGPGSDLAVIHPGKTAGYDYVTRDSIANIPFDLDGQRYGFRR